MSRESGDEPEPEPEGSDGLPQAVLPGEGGRRGIEEIRQQFQRDNDIASVEAGWGINGWSNSAPGAYNIWLRDDATAGDVRDLYQQVLDHPKFDGTSGSAQDAMRDLYYGGLIGPDALSRESRDGLWDALSDEDAAAVRTAMQSAFDTRLDGVRGLTDDELASIGEGLQTAIGNHPGSADKKLDDWLADLMGRYNAELLRRRARQDQSPSTGEGEGEGGTAPDEGTAAWFGPDGWSATEERSVIGRTFKTKKAAQAQADDLAGMDDPDAVPEDHWQVTKLPDGTWAVTRTRSATDDDAVPKLSDLVPKTARQRLLESLIHGRAKASTGDWTEDRFQRQSEAIQRILDNPTLLQGSEGFASAVRGIKTEAADDPDGKTRYYRDWTVTHTPTGFFIPDRGLVTSKAKAQQVVDWLDAFIAANPDLDDPTGKAIRTWRSSDNRSFADHWSEMLDALEAGDPFPDPPGGPDRRSEYEPMSLWALGDALRKRGYPQEQIEDAVRGKSLDDKAPALVEMLLADDAGSGTPGEWTPSVGFMQPGDDLTGKFSEDDVYWVPVNALRKLQGNEGRPAGERLRANVDIGRMADEMRENGIRDDNYLIVEYNPHTGDLKLGEGNHRLRAARDAGIEALPVRVAPSVIRDTLWKTDALNMGGEEGSSRGPENFTEAQVQRILRYGDAGAGAPIDGPEVDEDGWSVVGDGGSRFWRLDTDAAKTTIARDARTGKYRVRVEPQYGDKPPEIWLEDDLEAAKEFAQYSIDDHEFHLNELRAADEKERQRRRQDPDVAYTIDEVLPASTLELMRERSRNIAAIGADDGIAAEEIRKWIAEYEAADARHRSFATARLEQPLNERSDDEGARLMDISMDMSTLVPSFLEAVGARVQARGELSPQLEEAMLTSDPDMQHGAALRGMLEGWAAVRDKDVSALPESVRPRFRRVEWDGADRIDEDFVVDQRPEPVRRLDVIDYPLRDEDFEKGVDHIPEPFAKFLNSVWEATGQGGIIRVQYAVSDADAPSVAYFKAQDREGRPTVRQEEGSADTRSYGEATAHFSPSDGYMVVSDKSIAQEGKGSDTEVVSHETGHALDWEIGTIVKVAGMGDLLTAGRGNDNWFSTYDPAYQQMRRDIVGIADNGADGSMLGWYYLNGTDGQSGAHNGSAGTTEFFGESFAIYTAMHARAARYGHDLSIPEEELGIQQKGDRESIYLTSIAGLMPRSARGSWGMSESEQQERRLRAARLIYDYWWEMETVRLPELMAEPQLTTRPRFTHTEPAASAAPVEESAETVVPSA